jgi:hypothetical protein
VIVGDVLQPLMLGPVLKGVKAAYFAVPCLPSKCSALDVIGS